MKKSLKIILTVVFSAAMVTVCVVGGIYYIDNKKPNFTEECFLYVYPDTGLEEISAMLETDAGMVRKGSLWRCFGKVGLKDDPSKLKPGKYVVTPQSTSIEIARKLLFGWQTSDNRLVLSGTIRTKERLAQKIGAQMMVDSASVYRALNDSLFLSKFGLTAENVFGMLLKDTYEMYWTLSIDDIFKRFSNEYNRFWNDERRAKAQAQGLTPGEVMIMASIVTGESLVAAEYPMIAGVYLNRYHRGMRLQADPTIAYCHDYKLDRILKVHLKVDSPYNTYKHAGLPPAPINVPEKASIEAVLNPTRHDYLYFCANPDFNGTHRFAASYSEHLRNAREFQRALNRRRAKSVE